MRALLIKNSIIKAEHRKSVLSLNWRLSYWPSVTKETVTYTRFVAKKKTTKSLTHLTSRWWTNTRYSECHFQQNGRLIQTENSVFLKCLEMTRLKRYLMGIYSEGFLVYIYGLSSADYIIKLTPNIRRYEFHYTCILECTHFVNYRKCFVKEIQ